MSTALVACAALTGCAGPRPPASGTADRLTPLASEWAEFALPGKRRTTYVTAIEDGRRIVHAHAFSSASMLRRTVRIHPHDIAGIEFSWRASSLIDDADLGRADSSDSPVRIVLAFDGDTGRLSNRNRMLFDLAHALTGEPPPFATLMYVWDNRAGPETLIHSARTDRVRKIVVQSGGEACGRWLHYRRDVLADYRRAFGEEPGMLIGVALMTDTDNTQSTVAASYGEVRVLRTDGQAH
jgi:hypothetical protein